MEMKRIATAILVSGMVAAFVLPAPAQLGGLMNKVKNKIVDKALGIDSSSGEAAGQDPDCATPDALKVFEFDKGFKVARNELSAWVHNGDILLLSRDTGKYFIKRKNAGSPEGPYNEDDPAVVKFKRTGDAVEGEGLIAMYPEYLQKTGDKVTIRLGGKIYGPYAEVVSFVVNDSGTRFAATISMDKPGMSNDMEKIGKLMENAKTDQERMQIAMQYQQTIMDESLKISQMDVLPKLVTNVEGAGTEVQPGAYLSSTVRYDDIVWVELNRITDLAGTSLFEWDPYKMSVEGDKIWLSSDNRHYAAYSDGVLTIDGTRRLNQLFSPYRTRDANGEFLHYLYFSPVNNAIMQASIPF